MGWGREEVGHGASGERLGAVDRTLGRNDESSVACVLYVAPPCVHRACQS